MRPSLLRWILALLLAAGPAPAARASRPPVRQVRVAAAADLKWALEEVRTAFAKRHPGISCTLTFGSSGQFFAQLSGKAPFDLFLSADLAYPEQLAAQGLGLKDSRFDYAVGRLVAWVPAASPVPVETLGLKSVGHPAVCRVALANPRHAPYGRAAEAALKAAGLHEGVKDRLVLGENIAQAAQFVQTGNADLGLLALSLALSPPLKDRGRFWIVPEALHPPLRQGGVILAWAQDVEAARAFAAFLAGPEGAAILDRYGFARPGRP